VSEKATLEYYRCWRLTREDNSVEEEWRCRLVANGKPLLTSEPYSKKAEAEKALDDVKAAMAEALKP
jgi:uncharacterized protein YegP (UPF0339 family)